MRDDPNWPISAPAGEPSSPGARTPARDLAITFAGGGNRAFYQLGLMRHWGPRLQPRIAALATCSAGACVAAMWLADREEPARTLWLERTRGITRNLDWRRWLRGERLAPHGAILREIMVAVASDGGLDRIRAAPYPVLVLASAFPGLLPSGLAVALGIGLYQLERVLRPAQLHARLGANLLFRPAVFDMRDCSSPDALADLVLASSATPPFTPLGRYGGRPLLDGGMIDNAPAFIAEALPSVKRHLVLLTRYPVEAMPPQRARLYVAPSSRPPLERWDYTQPHLIVENVALGARDSVPRWTDVEALLAGEA